MTKEQEYLLKENVARARAFSRAKTQDSRNRIFKAMVFGWKFQREVRS
jgi:hypothetical protein